MIFFIFLWRERNLIKYKTEAGDMRTCKLTSRRIKQRRMDVFLYGGKD